MSRITHSCWALALLLLSGCGMYGGLYLEEEAPGVPEITEAPPIALDEPATGGAANGAEIDTPIGDDEAREDDERGDGKREDDTAGAS